MSIKLTPTWFIKEYSSISIEFLKKQSIKTIFADIDNTLVDWDELDTNDTLQTWVQQLKENHIEIILVSNNRKNRIERVAEQLDVPYVFPGLKPLHKGFKEALSQTTATKDEIVMIGDVYKRQVMIGDQLLTDILGAGTFGIKTILVKPLKLSDAKKTRINRFFENVILTILYGKNYSEKWEEKIHD